MDPRVKPEDDTRARAAGCYMKPIARHLHIQVVMAGLDPAILLAR
ncbi:MAG: hypothetical protein U1E46_02585 [Hyphomicrobiales bacterium]